VAYDGADIWVSDYGSNTLTKLSAVSGATLGSVATSNGPSYITFDGANIWVANLNFLATSTVTKF
jgi:hypothetical protein